MTDMKPSIGRTVHYRSYGTPGGEYNSECCAAIITEVDEEDGNHRVGLAVLRPTGIFLNQHVCYSTVGQNNGGTWHWPERIDSN